MIEKKRLTNKNSKVKKDIDERKQLNEKNANNNRLVKHHIDKQQHSSDKTY